MVVYLGGLHIIRVCTVIIRVYHKHHVKHTSKPWNLDHLKSESERDTIETPTCAVPVHAPQTNARW